MQARPLELEPEAEPELDALVEIELDAVAPLPLTLVAPLFADAHAMRTVEHERATRARSVARALIEDGAP